MDKGALVSACVDGSRYEVTITLNMGRDMLANATVSNSMNQLYFTGASVYPVFGILGADSTSNLEFV